MISTKYNSRMFLYPKNEEEFNVDIATNNFE